MSLRLLASNDKLAKPNVPTDNTYKTAQLHFKKFKLYASELILSTSSKEEYVWILKTV